MSTYPYQVHEHQGPTSWQDQLESAVTESEIVSVARDFIAQFTPQEIEQLPAACRPGKFFEADDITAYAFSLMRHTCAVEDETAALVHRLAAFFSNASIRLSQIMAAPNPQENAAREAV